MAALIRLGRSTRDVFNTGIVPTVDSGGYRVTTRGVSRDFATSTYTRIPPQTRYYGTNENGFTVITWAVVDSLTNYSPLTMCQTTTTTNGWEMRIGGSTATSGQFLAHRANAGGYRSFRASTSNIIAAGTDLQMLAASFADNIITTTPLMFYNGTSVTGVPYAGTGTGAITESTGDLYVARRYDGATQLDGSVLMVALFDRGLQHNELQAIYNNPAQLFEPEFIQVYWPSAGGGGTGNSARVIGGGWGGRVIASDKLRNNDG